MAEIIGTVKLGDGRAAFFDPSTNIYLTMQNPVAHVTSDMKTARLKNGVRAKTISLISGTLDVGSSSRPLFQQVKEILPAPKIEEKLPEPAVEEVKSVEVVKEEPVVEAAAESVIDTTEPEAAEVKKEPEVTTAPESGAKRGRKAHK